MSSSKKQDRKREIQKLKEQNYSNQEIDNHFNEILKHVKI